VAWVNDLQDLVDALAAELGRPVGLDDRRFRSLAYSSHLEQIDQVRLSSILHREAPKAVMDYLTSLRIDTVDDHLRIAANPGLGMAARVCLPARFGGALLGYVWLFDEPTALADAEIELARRFAVEAGTVLYRLTRLDTADRARERELLAELLGLHRGDPRRAADALTSVGFLAKAALTRVVVLRATSAASAAIDDNIRVRLAAAADDLRRSSPPNQVISLTTGDYVVALVTGDDESVLDRGLTRLVECTTKVLADEAHWSPVIGASAPQATLERMPAAYREARDASDLVIAQGRPGPLARWEHLGAYRTILRLVDGDEPAAAVPRSLRALLHVPDAPILVDTLLTYLDNAGDVKVTAEQLYVHRSSLYNRLHRIEALAGVDMRSGDDRLELHLGLRLWHLSGGTLGGP
jgi:sugar diacid utilization regulator